MRIGWACATAALAIAASGAARAEVVDVSESGFRIRNVATIAASPETVYAALGRIGRWWDPAHSYSEKAGAMTLSLTPGGCFCETVGTGGARHGVVVLALPNRLLRIDAALGPLEDEAATGALTFEITKAGAGVEVVQTYNVSALRPDSAKRHAGPVDHVIGEQLQRFKRYVETGTPD